MDSSLITWLQQTEGAFAHQARAAASASR